MRWTLRGNSSFGCHRRLGYATNAGVSRQHCNQRSGRPGLAGSNRLDNHQLTLGAFSSLIISDDCVGDTATDSPYLEITMSDAFYHRGLTIEVDLDFPRATIEGLKVPKRELSRLFRPRDSDRKKTERVLLHCKQLIDSSSAFHKREEARREHLKKLKEGVEEWNKWREENPQIRPLLYNSDLREKTIGKRLNRVNFANAVLINADLRGQNFRSASFHEANLGGAKLHGADLTAAVFCRADLYETEMPKAKLIRTNLQGTQLAKTDFSRARLDKCKVYGMSAWDLKFDRTTQKNLLIRYRSQASNRNKQDSIATELEVDDLQVAQFIYMLLNNHNLRTVINAATSSIVLILGRFSKKRKKVLDAMREELRSMKGSYVPILFDFKPSHKRDLSETIQLLANLSKLVIADLSDAKSIPQELSQIVPNLPSVPIQPILLARQKEYAMFEHWRRYPWVLPEFKYKNKAHLLQCLKQKVIQPAVTRREFASR